MNLYKLFQQVLLLSVMGSILALGILIIKAVLRKKLSAKFHYFIWFLLILRLIIPFNIQSHISLFNFIPAQNSKLDSSFIEAQNYSNIKKSSARDDINIEKDASKNNNKVSIPDSKKIGFNFQTAALIWIIGVFAAFLYIISINIIIAIKLKRLKHCDNKEVLKTLEAVKLKLKVGAKIEVLYDTKFNSPAVYGLIRPRILISKDIIDRITDENLRYIFLHEVTHVKRRDLLLNTAIIIIQTLYWFNPLIWYSLYQFKQDCEAACDATALAALDSEEIKEYGQTIINMLQLISKSNAIYGTMGFASRYSKRRIIMISRFRKNSAIWAVLALSFTLMVGCSSTIKPTADNAGSTTDKNVSSSTNTSTDTKNTASDNSGNNVNTAADNSNLSSSNGSTSNNNNLVLTTAVQDQQKALLASIMSLAKQGKIINSSFPVKTTVIDTVEKKLGKADKVDWVPAAKGNYATFSKYNVVFGFNKGSQIFEARSFDNRLNKITLSMVKKVYGTPAYDVKNKNEEIIGYTAGKEYKILFVFPKTANSSKDLKLDHYSVLYPRGTVNMMADDPGRQW